MIGTNVREIVCLDKQQLTCAELTFVSVVDQQGLNGLKADGIVGMAPSAQSDLFVTQLYNDRKISQNVFAFVLGRNNESS